MARRQRTVVATRRQDWHRESRGTRGNPGLDGYGAVSPVSPRPGGRDPVERGPLPWCKNLTPTPANGPEILFSRQPLGGQTRQSIICVITRTFWR